jgi:hypothetical protein
MTKTRFYSPYPCHHNFLLLLSQKLEVMVFKDRVINLMSHAEYLNGNTMLFALGVVQKKHQQA